MHKQEGEKMSTDAFTAQDAWAMTKKSDPEWHVEQILLEVKKAAERGEFRLKTYACDFGNGSLYGGKPTALQQAVIDKINGLGFKAGIEAQERQFVDIWLEVSWGHVGKSDTR